MRSMKRVFLTAAAVAALSATSVLPASAAPPEQAAPNDMSTQTHCIRVNVHDFHWFSAAHVHMTNICSTTQHVKVIIAWDLDSQCYPIAGRGQLTHSHWGTFDGLVSC